MAVLPGSQLGALPMNQLGDQLVLLLVSLQRFQVVYRQAYLRQSHPVTHLVFLVEVLPGSQQASPLEHQLGAPLEHQLGDHLVLLLVSPQRFRAVYRQAYLQRYQAVYLPVFLRQSLH